jgi:hypothetical protein
VLGILIGIATTPETAKAGRFISFTSPKVTGAAVGANDLNLTLTNGAMISKGTAVLPNNAWPAPGNAGNGMVVGGNSIIFTTVPGSTLAMNDVVTGTISLSKNVKDLAITSAAWSFSVPPGQQGPPFLIPFNFPATGVQVTKLNTGGGSTGIQGEVVVTNESNSTQYYQNARLSYSIPASNFVDDGNQLAVLTSNNLFIGSGTPESISLTKLDPGQSAIFDFGNGHVDAMNYIGISFDVYSSPTPSDSTYLGSIAEADNVVPEPSTLVSVMIAGVVGLSLWRRRRAA